MPLDYKFELIQNQAFHELLNIELDLVEVIDDLIKFDKFRREQLVMFRSLKAETAFRELIMGSRDMLQAFIDLMDPGTKPMEVRFYQLRSHSKSDLANRKESMDIALGVIPTS